MVAHDRHEAAPLHPTHLQFLHGNVFPIVTVFPAEETTDIGIPIRYAAEGVVQSACDLFAHYIPLGHNIATPAERTIALLSEVGGASHEKQSFAIRYGTLVFIYALVA